MAEVNQADLNQTESIKVSDDVTKGYANPANNANFRHISSSCWKPGQSGNPSGRPKKRPITEMYRKVGENEADLRLIPKALRAVAKGKTFAELVAIGQYLSAFKGIALSAREIADRIEGKVADRVEVTGSLQLTLAERIARARQIEVSESLPELTEGEP